MKGLGWGVVVMASAGVLTADAGHVVDRFGVTELWPTAPLGRTWTAKWDRGPVRTLASGDRDPLDSEFIMRGSGTVKIDGRGVAVISGDCPRLYVYDEPRRKKWCNLEVTIYVKRIQEDKTDLSYRGFAIGTRSEHQDYADKVERRDGRVCSPSAGAGYYGKFLYDGRVAFMKELIHNPRCGYTGNKPSEGDRRFWNTPGHVLPADVWIGMKMVLRNTPQKTVKMELFRDLTDGRDGGHWEKLVEYTDAGGWRSSGLTSELMAAATPPGQRVMALDEILLRPGTSVYVRNDGIVAAACKSFSIREIEPLKSEK